MCVYLWFQELMVMLVMTLLQMSLSVKQQGILAALCTVFQKFLLLRTSNVFYKANDLCTEQF